LGSFVIISFITLSAMLMQVSILYMKCLRAEVFWNSAFQLCEYLHIEHLLSKNPNYLGHHIAAQNILDFRAFQTVSILVLMSVYLCPKSHRLSLFFSLLFFSFLQLDNF
jgi:hypothetical protein